MSLQNKFFIIIIIIIIVIIICVIIIIIIIIKTLFKEESQLEFHPILSGILI